MPYNCWACQWQRNCDVVEKRKIVILDAYVANPGDYSWAPLEEFGDCDIWQRTESASEALERAAAAEIVLTDKVGCDATS